MQVRPMYLNISLMLQYIYTFRYQKGTLQLSAMIYLMISDTPIDHTSANLPSRLTVSLIKPIKKALNLANCTFYCSALIVICEKTSKIARV